ncbi:MAG: carboxypeptidase-like regulatory domain-containing protein [Bacteroidota bacterium]|nr:carboxypeptidase-like regulatory domain-containing protein [Bacteroidota bacterium]
MRKLCMIALMSVPFFVFSQNIDGKLQTLIPSAKGDTSKMRVPLQSAMLILVDEARNMTSSEVYTDQTGSYHFENVPKGTYKLKVWKNGSKSDTAPSFEKLIYIGNKENVLPTYIVK